MFTTNLDYEEVMEVLEEESEKVKLGIKKIALMHKDTILQLFDINADIESIEREAIKIAKNTLQFDNIDLCYIVIDKKYLNITYKNIIQKDIIREELEDYQVIDGRIYVLGNIELKTELLNYSKNIFNEIIGYSDTFFEICNELIYDDCISWIFKDVENTYNNGYTIFTTNNSFILHGSYLDAMTTDFESSHYILNKDTKLFLIDEIENSDLSETAQTEIIEKIKNY